MRSVARAALFAGAVSLLALAGCTSSDGSSDASSSPSTSGSDHSSHSSASHEGQISFALATQGSSGQEGLAIAYPSGDDMTVMTVAMQGGPAAGGAAQTAVIHKGTCSDVGAEVQKLMDVEGGGSFTQFEGTLDNYVADKNVLVVSEGGDAVACGVIENGKIHPPSEPIPAVHTLEIKEQNLSGQSGTATLTPSDDGQSTNISIQWNNQPSDIEQLPTHIHQSKCATLDPMVMVPLANIIDNQSTTNDIPVPLSKLLEKDQFSINVHHDPSALPFYVGCGTISDAKAVQ